MSRTFKIIGLRVKEQCPSLYRKVLLPETTYFLIDGYEDDGAGFIRKIDGTGLDEDFFRTKNINSPSINISCIVGHNGDGKSSLVELMIRILNNFSYCAGFRSDHNSLRFIPNLYSILFYQIDSTIYCISCSGETVELKDKSQIIWSRDLSKHKAGKEQKFKRSIVKSSSTLFYTLVNNYSLYAYNSEDFKIETNDDNEFYSWINALFHKNDAYQTPIVISPMRERGDININREYGLSTQRFGELFLNCKYGKFKISDSVNVDGFAYKIEPHSKLLTRTIREYILDRSRGNRNVIIMNKSFSTDRGRPRFALNLTEKNVFLENISFWKNFDKSFYDCGLLNIARTIILEESDGTEHDTDLYAYLSRMKAKTRKNNYKRAHDNIEEFLSNGGGILTFLQFQRLFLVFEIYKQWTVINSDIVYKKIDFQNMSYLDHACFYLIYKTIRVVESYPDFFSGGLMDYESTQHFFNQSVRMNNINKWYEAINGDYTHITLKIRQTLYYIRNHKSLPFYNSKEEMSLYKGSVLSVLSQIGYDRYIDAKEYYSLIKDESEFAATLPAPIFQIDYFISRRGEVYPLSRMSSGERQLLNSSSAIIYHLKNIDSSKAKQTKIAYENVNIVLEEVELYFHPEYQRQFVKYLINQIENAYLSPQLAINIIIITHSPFILSDIPRQNVLFLRDGSPDRSMQEDTFGANIHTLLQNGFFLNSVPIGEFAKDKIAKMFEILNRSESISREELSMLGREILLVSEPLLRSQLMRLFSQRKNFEQGENQTRIEELERMIQLLKTAMNDKN